MTSDFFYDWKTTGKKRSGNQIIGESGVEILKALFPKEWVIREYTIDYGIDLDVELFEKCDENIYITKGEHVLFQVKTTNKLKTYNLKVYSSSNADKECFYTHKVIKYSLDTSLLATVERMGSSIPVLLCLVDNINKEGYFVCLNDYIEKILLPQNPNYSIQDTVIINIPIENKISSSKQTIEWYGKRAKLYSFFNLINFQNRELKYTSYFELYETINIFLKRLGRLDIWTIPILKIYKEQIDYFLENQSTKFADQQIKNALEQGKNVDEEIWETSYCYDLVSFRQATIIQSLHKLWEDLCCIADMYEDIYKESFLPTYYWGIINDG